jgi:hypothetical protein
LGEEKKKPGKEFNAEIAEDAEGAEKRGCHWELWRG